MAGRTRLILGSNGQKEARVYTVMPLPSSPPAPAVEIERVRLLDPRQTSTVVSGTSASTGPRNPEQRLAQQVAPGVDLPDGLPATKAQRVLLDPELVAQWRAEAASREGGGA